VSESEGILLPPHPRCTRIRQQKLYFYFNPLTILKTALSSSTFAPLTLDDDCYDYLTTTDIWCCQDLITCWFAW